MALAAAAAGGASYPPVRTAVGGLFGGFGPKRVDVIPHKVTKEFLQVTVVERGTLESADNKDVVCRVKAGSKGTFASTIRWVIDDGTIVTKGQLLMELDDSALQDSFAAQSIVVEKARAELVTAEEDLVIIGQQNQSDIATAVAAFKLAELDLDKYTGVRVDPTLEAFAALTGAPGLLVERGEYRQKLDDVTSRLKLADADLEAYRDRVAWSDRMVRLKYVTPSAAKVDQSKLAAAVDNVSKLRTEKNILEGFLRPRESTDLSTKYEVAKLGSDRSVRQAHSKEVQAESKRRTAYSVYHQELEKQKDIEEQVRECKVMSPQDGMVVYYKEGGNRFGSSSEGMIQQGAQVKEGQKLIRIPDLRKMQVNTKVHEAMVSRIRGDDRQSTGVVDALRAGLLAAPGAFPRLVGASEQVQSIVRDANRDREYKLVNKGQEAKVRIDAFPDRLLKAHVRTVAAVASQADFFSSDVKVYQTLVTVDDYVEGLKPDMSAEVTIQVDPPEDKVVCVPIQAVVGGAESGPNRRVYVLTDAGPVERPVQLGLFNDKMVEVRGGLEEGETVVLNPKVVLGDKAKTRDETAAPSAPRTGAGGGGKDKKGGKGAGGKGRPPVEG